MKSLESIYGEVTEQHLRHATGLSDPRARFIRDRFAAGKRISRHLRSRYGASLGPTARILDLGCGNGGFSLPFCEGAADGLTVGVDIEPHPELCHFLRQGRVPYAHAAAKGQTLPFRNEAFDLVLLVETLEHLESPGVVTEEVRRVLKPGGICFVTTPARLRFLFGKDPHRNIWGLLLLPDRLQSWMCKLAIGDDTYDVAHTFWTSWGIGRLFPGLRLAEVTSRNWKGFFRRLDWDWLVFEKPSEPDRAHVVG